MKQYIEITPKTKRSKELIFLSNGDRIFIGGGIYIGLWFWTRKASGYTGRLPDAKTYEEALEVYQQQTGNCII